MHNKQLVTVIYDSTLGDRSFIELIKRYQDVNLVHVKSLSNQNFKQSLLVIIQVNLADLETLYRLKDLMPLPKQARVPVLFLLSQFSRREVVQANMLGATENIPYPCSDDYFINTFGKLTSRTVEKAWSKLTHRQEIALKVSLKAVGDTFRNAAAGIEISQDDVKNSCNLIIEATAQDGLTDWMNAIRLHHNYTYRHGMMVCGYLLSFGMLLGFKKSDLHMLAVGGLLHDIGKAMTPLDILDKPAKLTPSEWTVMKKHASNARFILEEKNWDERLIDIALHHHEKLDGTGYPNGLKGGDVSDLARMSAIADVFSGITDKRSYKAAMSAEKAIEIMLTMEGHLDLPLVKAFRAVALTGNR